jgi:hypothetical protein
MMLETTCYQQFSNQESVKRRRWLSCLALYRANNNTQIQFICTSEYIYFKYTTQLTPLLGVTNANTAYVLKINVKGEQTKYFIVNVPLSGRYTSERQRSAQLKHQVKPAETFVT